MDALTLRACLVSQRDAAQWYATGRRWRENAENSYGSHAAMCRSFAAKDQEIAAQLALADRTFRGLEG